MKYITIKLTEDQRLTLKDLVEDYMLAHKMRSYHTKTDEQKKEYAFLRRLLNTINAD